MVYLPERGMGKFYCKFIEFTYATALLGNFLHQISGRSTLYNVARLRGRDARNEKSDLYYSFCNILVTTSLNSLIAFAPPQFRSTIAVCSINSFLI